MLQLRWKASLSATCLHAALCRRRGIPAAEAALEAAIAAPADELIGELSAAAWPIDASLEQMASLAADYEINRELVARCLARLRLPVDESVAAVRVAGAVADLEAALVRHQPQLVDELAVRGGPIREQWEARGPGLLREAARLAEADVVPPSAEVVLVAPYAGGHGFAHAAQNRVSFEAVLANPVAELPESVRLAWLACQLNSDLPRFADALSGGRAARAFALAVVPPVLAAAEAVELTRGDAAAVDRALDAWRLREGLPPDAGERLASWWNAWLDHPESWTVAVAALEQIMA